MLQVPPLRSLSSPSRPLEMTIEVILRLIIKSIFKQSMACKAEDDEGQWLKINTINISTRVY